MREEGEGGPPGRDGLSLACVMDCGEGLAGDSLVGGDAE